ncbi:hypothetical protein KY285_032360 [Solanum tuberosum]|nr:hypothetical protein KY285_032360 [Solanum tuberosum]
MSSNNGEGPSLHTGGSVAFAEYRRRHKELTGKELRNDELFLMTHKTKNDKKWICGKSERLWINQFIKERGAPSHQEVSKSIFSLHFPETVNRNH